MAASRKKPVTIEDVFPENITPPVSNFPVVAGDLDEYDDVTALNNVLAEVGAAESGGGFINVYREKTLPGGRRQDEYIDRFEASEFANGGLLDSIKDKWGAGTFKVHVYRAGGHGLAARKTITIAADPHAVAPVAHAPQSPDLTPVLAAIQQSAEKQAGMMMQLIQAIGQKHEPSRMDMLKEMQLMAEMFRQPQQPTGGQNYNPVEMMKLGMEMAQMGGGDSNNAWVSKMIETFGGPMMEMIAASKLSEAATPTRPAASRPALPSAPAAPTPRPEIPKEENSVNMLITSYLNFLKDAAAKNAPVEEYADSILATLPETEHATLENLLKPDDWRENIKKHTGVVELYPDWFTGLRGALLLFIEEDRQQNGLTTPAIPGTTLSHDSPNSTTDGGDTGVPGDAA